MKFLGLLSFTAFLLHINALQHVEWEHFKLKYGKKYDDLKMENHHMEAFNKNLLKINQHNKLHQIGKTSFTLGLNKYSDLTYEEFSKIMLMNSNHNRTFHKYTSKLAVVNAPESIDWRDFGYVTAVKDQGSCGSCYAFSAVGGLEGQHFKKTNELISLSEQNILDCSVFYGNNGCNGGYIEASFDYVSDNDGIDTEREYPYDGYEMRCRYTSSGKGASCQGYRSVPSGDEFALKEIVAAIGPISGCIYASESFHQYSGGIYYGFDCPSGYTNHCILIVGYGSSNGVDYWIVKNSWGRSWGEDGYIRMARNQNNNCQIAESAHYPIGA